MNKLDSARTYVIKPCTAGYGIYDRPYWYLRQRHEGLYMTCRTKEECIAELEACNATYILQD